MSSAAIGLALILGLAGCRGPAAPPAEATRRPRGAAAYSGERQVETRGLGQAGDGTLLAASDGAAIRLSSFYSGGAALVVFYRGHW